MSKLLECRIHDFKTDKDIDMLRHIMFHESNDKPKGSFSEIFKSKPKDKEEVKVKPKEKDKDKVKDKPVVKIEF